MLNKNQSAFPGTKIKLYNGLTKREYMATQIAAGLSADPTIGSSISEIAVKIADELLRELHK